MRFDANNKKSREINNTQQCDEARRNIMSATVVKMKMKWELERERKRERE